MHIRTKHIDVKVLRLQIYFFYLKYHIFLTYFINKNTTTFLFHPLPSSFILFRPLPSQNLAALMHFSLVHTLLFTNL